jgi:hypothetical protein
MSNIKSITLSGKQLLDALSMIIGSPSRADLTPEELETEINITKMEAWHDKEEGEQPAGLYASLEEYPEEGLYGPLGDTHEARKIEAKAKAATANI